MVDNHRNGSWLRLGVVGALCTVALLASACVSNRNTNSSNTTPEGAVSKTTIKIGFERSAASLPGFTAAGTAQQYLAAVVADVNAHGGIAGRKVELVSYLPNKSVGTYDTQDQAECTFFTQQDPVFAVVEGPNRFSFRQCLQQHHVISISRGNGFGMDAQEYSELSDSFSPPWVNLNRLATNYVDGLDQEGFFKGGARIGLVSMDLPEFHSAVSGSLIPALRQHGLQLSDASYIPPLTSNSDSGRAVAAIQAAALKFKGDHVDRVLFLLTTTSGELYFMSAGYTQAYSPRYGLSSNDAPGIVASELGQDAARAELNGSVFVGWAPLYDVLPAQYPVVNPALQHCMDLMQGIGLSLVQPNDRLNASDYCEDLSLLQQAGSRVKGALTDASMVRAIDDLGSSFVSSEAMGTHFAKGMHDGADVFRYGAFDSSCACFKYTSGPMTVTKG